MLTPWLFEDWELTLHSLGSRLTPFKHTEEVRLCPVSSGFWGLYWETDYFGSQPDSSNLSPVPLGKLNMCLLARMLAALDQGHGFPTCP